MLLSLNGKIYKIIIVVIVCMIFSGCANFGTYNPATDRREFIFVNAQAEDAMGRDTHNKILQEYKLSSDKNKIVRLNKIGQQVALVSDRQDYSYKFFLIDKEELNAFTTPGGNIYIYSGLFDKLDNNQLASVLAHEIGHCAAKHTVKKFQAATGYSFASLAGKIILSSLKVDSSIASIASKSSSAVMNLVFSAYSRQDEYQADKLAVKYTYLSGFDVKGNVESLELLKKESNSPNTLLVLRSHPYLEDRIKNVNKEIEGIKSQYEN